MKILVIGATIVFLAIGLASHSFAGTDQALSNTVNATVGSIFSMEFYTDAFVMDGHTIPFSSVDPLNQYNYADGRFVNDGRSDAGVVCTSNEGASWYLKMHINPGSGLVGHLGCYTSQPIDRNSELAYPGNEADGTLTYVDWFNLSTTAETIYSAGAGDQNNTPFGTLATFNFKIDGSGLLPGSYNAYVTYTMTNTP